ncbi:ABC transporter substrate-binding protein [Paenibacillus sp. 1P07SE]|uniref:ABC transporter substrate-binding protein n=1 Tax=Paenibacillus sp. 1P07SE TaxID=3132209 RepID=UPI0039A4BF98
MWKRSSKRWGVTVLAAALCVAGCGGNEAQEGNNAGAGAGEETTKIRVVLDWTPNTNHTGLYVARDMGFYEQHGLEVEIISPPETGADQLIASGGAEFGVSYQEAITQARVQEVPIVSIAAVIQHNTSGFAAPVDKQIQSPADFEGRRYGGWGNPVEEAVITSLMQEAGADVSQVEFVNSSADFFTATAQDIDFAWIYYAWTGVEAELRGEAIDMLYVKDYSDALDYYTPVLATSERMIEERPELVRSFMAATAEGYRYAIEQPEAAAELLIAAEPDLNEELVRASQTWLSPRYQDDAARWGEQKSEVWLNYMEWMADHGVLEGRIDTEQAYTNAFLPE